MIHKIQISIWDNKPLILFHQAIPIILAVVFKASAVYSTKKPFNVEGDLV